jgi:hypothetical protein
MLHRLQSNAIIELGLEQLARFVWLISAICTRLGTSLERRPKSGVPSLQKSPLARDQRQLEAEQAHSIANEMVSKCSRVASGRGNVLEDKELEKWANDSGVFVHSSDQMMVVIDQIFFVRADYLDRGWQATYVLSASGACVWHRRISPPDGGLQGQAHKRRRRMR